MNRRFDILLQGLGREIGLGDERFATAEKLKRLGLFVGWLLMTVSYGAQSFWPTGWNVVGELLSPLFWTAVLILLVWIAAWKVRGVWDGIKEGPLVWIGKVGTEASFRAFEFPLENGGSGEVFAFPYAVNVWDRKGGRIGLIDDEMALHCRGYYVGDDIRLFGDRHVMVAFLQMQPGSTQGIAGLTLIVPVKREQGTHALVPLIPESPLKKQQKLYLETRVDFFQNKDKTGFITSKRMRAAIIPRRKSYRVRWVRWPWE